MVWMAQPPPKSCHAKSNPVSGTPEPIHRVASFRLTAFCAKFMSGYGQAACEGTSGLRRFDAPLLTTRDAVELQRAGSILSEAAKTWWPVWALQMFWPR